LDFGPWAFGFVSDFGFEISNFVFLISNIRNSTGRADARRSPGK
jgi:hypothetical protein